MVKMRNKTSRKILVISIALLIVASNIIASANTINIYQQRNTNESKEYSFITNTENNWTFSPYFPYNRFSFGFSTDKHEYLWGEPVKIMGTITNNGPNVTLLVFSPYGYPDSCCSFLINETKESYDFELIIFNRYLWPPIYHFPPDGGFHPCIYIPPKKVPIRTGETLELLIHSWNQVDGNGTRVMPGIYYVNFIVNYTSPLGEEMGHLLGCEPIRILPTSNKPPIAYFTYTPVNPVVNEAIKFNASNSADQDGTIVKYEWNFGDENITSTTEPIITHSYALARNYIVNLTVTDDRNSESYTSITIPVRLNLSYPINMYAVEEVYPLDPDAKDKLFNNGFLVLKGHEHGNISDCYWDLFFREDVSVFITSDAMLHIFHVVHDDMLRDIEKQYLYNYTKLLVQDMQRKSMQEYENTSSNLTHVKEAARRNVVFFTVACKLLNDSYPVPSCAEENVTEYVQKILNHSAAEFYPGDDYTQYEPRGHYEGDHTLENYFRCMKWLSRRIFRIEDYKYPEDSHIEMIQAVMISRMLEESPTDMQLWGKVYNVTTLLVGTADSITPVMVQKATENVFPRNFTISQLENATNIEKLRTEFKKTEYPGSQIIPVPLEYPGQIPPKYVQFMGERYVPDGYVFQQDTYPYISDVTRLPKGLEIMATMLGSNRADQLLEEEKKTYPELGSQMNKLKTEFENYTADKWTKNVYCNWFYTLDPLLVEFNQSYPVFMQTEAWQDEKLNTALSSWTQLRHDYILYAKQTYVPAPWAAGYGYVEPIPEFYNRLASLCRKINTELSDEDVLLQKYHDHFSSLANELDKFEKYSQKIVNNQTLTIEEQGDIHRFGLWLLGFFSGGIKEEEPTLVADVCTNSFTGKVLHEGVGKFNPVIIIYEQPDGITLAGVGFVMSYYEFTEENFNRISDSEWKERAEKGTLPPRPFWANSFLYNVR
uniref:PKD domain-containing protein n=1 Tax=Candidatus Methanophaga sp. ANME-1 ERB7 TaxID=2759913 RepID=A0A7G9Z3L5_9EURY|nr:hypothetical protein PAHOCELH_00010 [Methanosarcinales archaeon ANME-1 ERB7]